MRACRSAHLGGLLHAGRALPADATSVMDRQIRERGGGGVLVAPEPDRVVAGCHAFHRDPDRMLLYLARGGDASAYQGRVQHTWSH